MTSGEQVKILPATTILPFGAVASGVDRDTQSLEAESDVGDGSDDSGDDMGA